jgi:hypothetical protein
LLLFFQKKKRLLSLLAFSAGVAFHLSFATYGPELDCFVGFASSQ